MQGRLPGRPSQLFTLVSGSAGQAICQGWAKTGDPGDCRSGTGVISFPELELSRGNADGYGPVRSGGQDGLSAPIFCPWWTAQGPQNRTKSTHTAELPPATCAHFSRLRGQPRPLPSKKPVLRPPRPPSHSCHFYQDLESARLDPLPL